MWIQVVAMLFILSTALRLEISVLWQITECTEIRSKIEKRVNDSSAAIGYAWTSEKEKNLEKLLHEADEAMYENKKELKKER